MPMSRGRQRRYPDGRGVGDFFWEDPTNTVRNPGGTAIYHHLEGAPLAHPVRDKEGSVRRHTTDDDARNHATAYVNGTEEAYIFAHTEATDQYGRTRVLEGPTMRRVDSGRPPVDLSEI